MPTGQTVTCLLVTRAWPERFAFFQQSVADYCRQTYHRRELLVLSGDGRDEDHQRLVSFIASLGRSDIRVERLADNMTLGQKRNASIAATHGEVFCQWDDDDRYHPERVARQLEAMQDSGKAAVILQDVMQYYPREGVMYCTNWHATEDKGHAGTIMFARTAGIVYPEAGDVSELGEDSDVVRQLQRRNQMAVLADAPQLFIYVSHGANTWSDDHHRMLSDRLAISQGLLRRREAQLRRGLSAFDFGAKVVVQGSNGPAFTLERPG